MSTRHTFVLFDFDGVIADSYAENRAVSQMVCPHITEEMHRKAFETNIHESYPLLLQAAHGPECNHGLVWEDAYVPLFRKTGKLFPGMAEVVRDLAQQHQLILVSSAASGMIREFFDKQQLTEYFTDIMGNDIHFSKVEKMRMVFEQRSTDASHCVFVTDTLGDMREAQELSVGTIGCTWGVHPRETLEKGVPFRIVDSPEELPDAISEYFAVQSA